MDHLALVCILLLLAGAVEWGGTAMMKRFHKKTRLFSFSVWGSLMIIFSVIWLLES